MYGDLVEKMLFVRRRRATATRIGGRKLEGWTVPHGAHTKASRERDTEAGV